SAFFSPARASSEQAGKALAAAAPQTTSNTEAARPQREPEAKPEIQLASISPTQTPVRASLAGASPLPGVRGGQELFELRLGSQGDNGDVDVYEDTGETYDVASLAGMARLAP